MKHGNTTLRAFFGWFSRIDGSLVQSRIAQWFDKRVNAINFCDTLANVIDSRGCHFSVGLEGHLIVIESLEADGSLNDDERVRYDGSHDACERLKVHEKKSVA